MKSMRRLLLGVLALGICLGASPVPADESNCGPAARCAAS